MTTTDPVLSEVLSPRRGGPATEEALFRLWHQLLTHLTAELAKPKPRAGHLMVARKFLKDQGYAGASRVDALAGLRDLAARVGLEDQDLPFNSKDEDE